MGVELVHELSAGQVFGEHGIVCALLAVIQGMLEQGGALLLAAKENGI